MPSRIACAAALLLLSCAAAHAESACASASDPIATDRPSISNSSLVVPRGSLQSENGLTGVARRASGEIDATSARLRLGVGGCTELLVDLPSRVETLSGTGASGFTDLAPALKHQLPTLPGELQLAATIGLGLPTGTRRIAGPGAQPYIQFPWSRPLADGWGLAGMLSGFWSPERRHGDPGAGGLIENNLAVTRSLTPSSDAFVEFVGDYPLGQPAVQQINAGAMWRPAPAQQLDVRAGFGLDHDAPRWFVGVGYSFRFDGLF